MEINCTKRGGGKPEEEDQTYRPVLEGEKAEYEPTGEVNVEIDHRGKESREK